MKIKNLTWLFLIIVLSTGFLSGCTGSTTIATSWPGLIVDQDTAYLAYNQHVYAIDITNGKEIWRFPEEPDAKITFYAPPGLTADNQLIVGSYNYVLYSLDAATGKEKWTFKNSTNRFIGSPLITDTTIYISNTDNSLYALDLQGNLLWSFETDGEQWAQPVLDPDGSKIYIPCMDHYLYAVSAEGKLIWKTEESLGGAVIGTPAIGSDHVLYVGSFGSYMFAIDTQNGEILWKVPTQAWVWSGPALKDDILYFGDLNNAFYALNTKTGDTLWDYTPDGPIVGTPLLTEDAIYFGSETGTMYSLNYQGDVIWSKPIEAKIYQSPVLAGDILLLAPVEKENILIAFDLNGNQKWPFKPEKK